MNAKPEVFSMFGVVTFLMADGMTGAGFVAAYLTGHVYISDAADEL